MLTLAKTVQPTLDRSRTGQHRSTAEGGLAEVVRVPDFELGRALAAARRGLFGSESAALPTIARYRVDRKLGSGGMGEVYLAFDPELAREVAIKLVRSELSVDAAGERLRAEARALGRLSHPNVVQVYDSGEHEGRTFIAMEYVDGETLRAWLTREPRGWKEVLGRFVAAGQGLEAAHAAGLVHRDFKPENVLLSDGGRVCVADFGLALSGRALFEGVRVEGAQLELGDRLSMTGAVLGTLRYMPLEQLRGAEVDHRADQFAFCVALYEALWEQPPFALGSFAERREALAGPPLPPSRAGGPSGLWKVIRRGLASEPSARWPDMRALLDALEAVPRRRRRLAWAGIIMPLALGPALLLAMRTPERSEVPDSCAGTSAELDAVWGAEARAQLRERFAGVDLPFAEPSAEAAIEALDDWVIEWADAREQLCRATVARTLPDELAGLRGACFARAAVGFETTLELLIEADAEVVEHAPRVVAELPELEACEDDQSLLLGLQPPPSSKRAEIEGIERELARIHVALLAGQGASLGPRLKQLRERVERLEYAPLTAALHHERGLWAFKVGERELGIQALSEAADLAESSRDDRQLARTWLALATRTTNEIDNWVHSEDWLRRARASNERVGLTPRVASMLEFGAAKLAEHHDFLDQAETRLRMALDYLDDPVLENDRRAQLLRPSYLGHLAGLLAGLRGRGEEVVELRRAALAAAEHSYPPGHPYVAAHAFNLGQLLLVRGQQDEARVLLERSADSWLQSSAQDGAQLGAALVALAQLELDAGELEQAQAFASQAETLLVDKRASVDLFNAVMSLAIIAHLRGELESALVTYERAAKLLVGLPNVDPARDPTLASLHASAGACALELGRYEQAGSHFERAVAVREPGPHTVVAGLGRVQLALREHSLERAAATLAELEDAQTFLDGGDELERSLLAALVALRAQQAVSSLPAELHEALADPEHEHHDRLVVVLRGVELSASERRQLALENPR